MKVVELQVENVKRIHAVEIRPHGAVVEITGRNAQGKSSVLDALWMAMAGERVVPSEPIRRGEEHARIRLDIGDYVVTRTFNARDDGRATTAIKVESAEGVPQKSPQGILNSLVGALTFDPLAFTQMRPEDQVATLKRFVPGVDFDALDQADARDYEARTEANRQEKRLRAQAEAIKGVTDAPAEPVDEAALVAALAGAADVNAGVERERAARAAQDAETERLEREGRALFAQAEELRRQAEEAENRALLLAAEVEARLASADARPPLPTPVSTEDLQRRIADARVLNARVAEAARKRRLTAEAAEAKAEADRLTAAMREREREREAALAGSVMPVPGLSFAAGRVLLNGLPLDQASDAERLRVSVAIAGALSPDLRVVRVRDGSLLDSEAWEVLRAHAEANDLQVWVETVESRRPSAIVIEDGRVREPRLAAAE